MMRQSPVQKPQLKVCGLTRADEALACVAAGADAIGCVFYPPSPRHVSLETAAAIAHALKGAVPLVGVFVDASYEIIMQAVRTCGLNAVQLHGGEPPALVDRLARAPLPVIKALFVHRRPFATQAPHYPAHAFLLESGAGRLPGGTAQAWNPEPLKQFSRRHPLVLAGGLSVENIAAAAGACQPDAVDVSSSVESAPGRKDPRKVKLLTAALPAAAGRRFLRRIFK